MYKKKLFLGVSLLMTVTIMVIQSCGKEVVYVYNEPSDNSGGSGGDNSSDPTDTPTIDFEALIHGTYIGDPSQNVTESYFIGLHYTEEISYSYFKDISNPNNPNYIYAKVACHGTFSLSNITVLETDYSGSPKKIEATLTAQYSDVSVDEDGGIGYGGTLNGYTHNQPCTKTHHIVWILGSPTYLVINGVYYKQYYN